MSSKEVGMNPIHKLAMSNIYASTIEDKQYYFKLVNTTTGGSMCTNKVKIYGSIVKTLPDLTSLFSVYVIGDIYPEMLNLKSQYKPWFRDVWTNFQADANDRKYTFQIYNDNGLTYPSDKVYYSFINETTLAIAIKRDVGLVDKFGYGDNIYLKVFSNLWHESVEFNNLPNPIGVYSKTFVTSGAIDRAYIMSYITGLIANGGDVIIHVNGAYAKTVPATPLAGTIVDVLYDQSIVGKTTYPISGLYTFKSELDDVTKLSLFRDEFLDKIRFKDTLEMYITDGLDLYGTTGLYFYKHRDKSVRNITNKDYSINGMYLENQVQYLNRLTKSEGKEKYLDIYTRRTNVQKPLTYASIKLHELYKLTINQLRELMNNNVYTDEIYRIETLEASDYFKVMNSNNPSEITLELATRAVGYNGVTKYLGDSPVEVDPLNTPIVVPTLYRNEFVAYEYGSMGELTNIIQSSGSTYTPLNPNTTVVSFRVGQLSQTPQLLLNNNQSTNLLYSDYYVLEVGWQSNNLDNNYIDITNDPSKVSVANGVITVTLPSNKKARIVYISNAICYTSMIDRTTSDFRITLNLQEDRADGNGVTTKPLTYTPEEIEVYLNKRRLTYGLDYTLTLPYINIYNREFIDYSVFNQVVDIRFNGWTDSVSNLNKREIRGFINNGVLTRNRVYDVIDDKVINIFVDGGIVLKEDVLFAESDTTSRPNDPLNGKPYTIFEPLIPIESLTPVPTLELERINFIRNQALSDVYSLVNPEDTVNLTQNIVSKYKIYSPLLNMITNDLLSGYIPTTDYIHPVYGTLDYPLMKLVTLLTDVRYSEYVDRDPVKLDIDLDIVDLRVHNQENPVNVSQVQYAFIDNILSYLNPKNGHKVILTNSFNVV